MSDDQTEPSETTPDRPPSWRRFEPAAYQFASGAAVSLGLVGLTVHAGRDLWLGIVLLVLALPLSLLAFSPSETAGSDEIHQLTQAIHELSSRLGSTTTPEQPPDEPAHPAPPRRPRHVARIAAATLTLAAFACATLVIIDASKTPKDYTSAYDDTDPLHTSCATGEVPVLAHVPLFGDHAQPIGVVRLKFSRYCTTIWVQVELTPGATRSLIGRYIQIVVHRPADNTSAPSPLLDRGTDRKGYGNQLGATACIEGTAQLLAGSHKPAGPIARTPCLSTPANA